MTADDAASWMVEELKRRRYLDHEIAVFEPQKLDSALVRYNDAGNLAIKPSVLKAFRTALPEDVVWSRSERSWRYRSKGDAPGRMQD